jgi:hypothetical protein
MGAVLLANAAIAQEQQAEPTLAAKAALQSMLAGDGRSWRMMFPQPTCLFRGGLCGAVRRDLTVAVPPRYDWVGRFFEGRAAVRLSGLYGFVDEDGREIVEPKYRIVGDYDGFGFVQVDVNGKSGLIDRDGKMVIEPKYVFISAIGSDRFRVTETRWVGGRNGSEDFSGARFGAPGWWTTALMQSPQMALRGSSGVIDISGQWIEPPRAKPEFEFIIDGRPRGPYDFDNDNPSMRWAWRDGLWGLQRQDGSWLVEPKFQQADRLIGELTRVMLNGKVGFIDREGNLAVEPLFDKAWPFFSGFDRTAAVRDGVPGVIDKSGAWVAQPGEWRIPFAMTFAHGGITGDNPETIRAGTSRRGTGGVYWTRTAAWFSTPTSTPRSRIAATARSSPPRTGNG